MDSDKLLAGMKTAEKLGKARGLVTTGFRIVDGEVEGIFISPPLRAAPILARLEFEEPKPRKARRSFVQERLL